MKLWTTQSHTTGRERKRRSNDLRRADKAAELRRDHARFKSGMGRNPDLKVRYLERVNETIWLDKIGNHTKTVLKDDLSKLAVLYDNAAKLRANNPGMTQWPPRGNA